MTGPGASGRVAVVTGAARGIGAAVVDRLVTDGWRVVASDLGDGPLVPGVEYALASEADLRAVAARHAGAVVPVVADVRDQAAVTALVARAEAEFGRVDAAVAAAGVMAGGAPLWDTTDEQWDALFDVCVRGVFHLARAATPALLRAEPPRAGRFVAIASSAAHTGTYALAAYNAAKHAVVGLVRGLAADLVGTGVTATAVSPGSTRTAMLAQTARQYGIEVDEFARHQLVRRILDPAEVADAVAWLCDPRASAVTGSVVHADGGFQG